MKLPSTFTVWQNMRRGMCMVSEKICSALMDFSLRCLPLLHEHAQRDELLDILVDAGESAWDRGAHEVFRPLID